MKPKSAHVAAQLFPHALTRRGPPCHSGLRGNVTSSRRRLPCPPIRNSSQSLRVSAVGVPPGDVSLRSFPRSAQRPPWRDWEPGLCAPSACAAGGSRSLAQRASGRGAISQAPHSLERNSPTPRGNCLLTVSTCAHVPRRWGPRGRSTAEGQGLSARPLVGLSLGSGRRPSLPSGDPVLAPGTPNQVGHPKAGEARWEAGPTRLRPASAQLLTLTSCGASCSLGPAPVASHGPGPPISRSQRLAGKS